MIDSKQRVEWFLRRVVLAGHSVAGEELSAVGAANSNRIAGLVYLDAAWDRTYSPPREPRDSKDSQTCNGKLPIASQPKPVQGGFDAEQAIMSGVQKPAYQQIRVPALALYAAPRTWAELVPFLAPGTPPITDPEQRACADRFVAGVARTRKHMAEEFKAGVAKSRVVELPGADHYIFRTHEVEVLREMRAFLDTLP